MEIGYQVLSNYEKAAKSMSPVSVGDKITKDKAIRAVVCNMLNIITPSQTEDGTEVKATLLEQIVASAIADSIRKGSVDKVLTWQKVLGELDDTSVNINVSKVDECLALRALGKSK